MPSPDLPRTQPALDALAQRLSGTTTEGYFRVHRNRYLSDLGYVASVHAEGAILEVGAYPCHLTALLHLHGYQVTGVDLDPGRARALIDHYGLDVRRCDIEREPLPFPDDTFRLVLFNEVLEHLRVDPLYALTQVHRVLCHDGTLMLTTPNLYAAQQVARYLTGRGLGDPVAEFGKLRAIGHMGHAREYSNRDVRRLLGACGFEPVETHWHHYHYPRGKRGTLARLVFAVVPRQLRSFQVVLARKRGPAPALSPLP
jgi:SAM-dependent methyltransferase